MFDRVWFVAGGTDELAPAFVYEEDSSMIRTAEAFSVTVDSFMVADDHDGFGRGENDIMLLTKCTMGSRPPVERIHEYIEELPEGEFLRGFLANSVQFCEAYNGTDRLWIEFVLVEVDSDDGSRKAAVSSFQSLAATAGAVFPASIPYTYAASAAVEAVEALISALEVDEKVLRVPIALHSGKGRPGYASLREGSYVIFSSDVEGKDFRLDQGGRVTRADGRPMTVTYAVFSIVRGQHQSPEYVISQKVATLLSQIHEGNSQTPRKAIEFIKETIEGYDNFGKLKEYRRLSRLTNPSEAELLQMERIRSLEAIQDFLPTNG